MQIPMSSLLDSRPFAPRDDEKFLAEMILFSRWHLEGCEPFRQVWPDWTSAESIEELPFLHVGIFGRTLLRTENSDLVPLRTLVSSATSGNDPSQILLDERSSKFQSKSSSSILQEMLGEHKRPLLVLDDVRSLRQKGLVSARVAAAMSLQPLASQIHFVMERHDGSEEIRWDKIAEILGEYDDLLVYGFTWILWTAWASAEFPVEITNALRGKRIHFVHSGGWKKLEQTQVDRSEFEEKLLGRLDPKSQVLDFYGLTEQVGMIYPLCARGFRHMPRWGDVLVRDPWTFESLDSRPGLLQLMNVLAWGAPYHNVLTEDLGRVVPGDCDCGLAGRRFELLGRIPKAEMRGCANV